MDPHDIKQHIRNYYSRLYASGRTAPAALPIRSGKSLAAALGYPQELLDLITDELWDLFAPCGNPLSQLHCEGSRKVLNLGCGVGIDSFALALEHPEMHVVGLDVVWDILKKGRLWCHASRLFSRRPSWVCGDAEELPFHGNCFDAVVANGVFNLFPDKPKLLNELTRVLKAQGRLVIADLAAAAPLPDYFEREADAWAWCMSGALTLTQLEELLERFGFTEVCSCQGEDEDMFLPTLVVCRRVFVA